MSMFSIGGCFNAIQKCIPNLRSLNKSRKARSLDEVSSLQIYSCTFCRMVLLERVPSQGNKAAHSSNELENVCARTNLVRAFWYTALFLSNN